MAQLMRDGDIAVGDVLGDVSEAYGAEGSAPLGFEVSKCKSKTSVIFDTEADY